MKAEQRKELETNTLANKVGQAMQRVKGSSRRGVLFYFVAALVLCLVGYFSYRWYVVSKQESSLQWLMLDDGSAAHLRELASKENNPGKAARLQLAWLTYWEEGVRMIGVDPQGSTRRFSEASKIYKAIAEECKDDPIFEPQALLGIAVVEETKAIQDIGALSSAKQRYKDVVEKYADSAEGKFAQKRLDLMNDKTKLAEMEKVYEDLQKMLNVPGAQAPRGVPGLEGFPPIIQGKDKDEKAKDKSDK